MDFSQLITMAFWNGLAKAHFPELVMVLTAGILVLADRYIRPMVARHTGSFNKVVQFLIFLLTCSAGYAALAMGIAWALRKGLTFSGGAYMAVSVLGILLIVAIEAQRQKQI